MSSRYSGIVAPSAETPARSNISQTSLRLQLRQPRLRNDTLSSGVKTFTTFGKCHCSDPPSAERDLSHTSLCINPRSAVYEASLTSQALPGQDKPGRVLGQKRGHLHQYAKRL